MADLSTTYMGIQLKNPIILGASNLVTRPDVVKELDAAGVAAIVYKSLFEEQIQLESFQLEEDINEYANRNSEMSRLFPDIEHAGPKEHIYNLKKLRQSTSLPIIASLNALYEPSWVEYAKLLEDTGVDALELNLYATPGYFEVGCSSIEEKQYQIVRSVKKAINIPVSVKLSPYYTNTLNFIKKLDEAGVDGFVLFNRFFQPEIDIDTESFYFPWELTQERDRHLSLRYTGLLYGNIEGSICASRGIYSAEDIIRVLLSGADAIQTVSAIYKNQPSVVTTMLKELNDWMDKKGYKNLSDFRGKLSRKNLKDPYMYQRAQYVDILMKSEEIFKKYPMI
jgi:dihydroorotate dehydrogenase (fumarate)